MRYICPTSLSTSPTLANSLELIELNWELAAATTASLVSNFDPRSANFRHRKSQKSYGARPWLLGGCSTTSIPCFIRMLLSYWKYADTRIMLENEFLLQFWSFFSNVCDESIQNLTIIFGIDGSLLTLTGRWNHAIYTNYVTMVCLISVNTQRLCGGWSCKNDVTRRYDSQLQV